MSSKFWINPLVVELEYITPFDVKNLLLEQLLKKLSYNVIGRIDMFALLKSLFPRLLDCLALKWMQSTQHLPKVCHNSVIYSYIDMTRHGKLSLVCRLLETVSGYGESPSNCS